MAFNQKILAWQCLETFLLSHWWEKKGLLLALKHLTIHRTPLTANNYPAPNVISANLEKPCYKVILSNTSGNFDAIGK